MVPPRRGRGRMTSRPRGSPRDPRLRRGDGRGSHVIATPDPSVGSGVTRGGGRGGRGRGQSRGRGARGGGSRGRGRRGGMHAASIPTTSIPTSSDSRIPGFNSIPIPTDFSPHPTMESDALIADSPTHNARMTEDSRGVPEETITASPDVIHEDVIQDILNGGVGGLSQRRADEATGTPISPNTPKPPNEAGDEDEDDSVEWLDAKQKAKAMRRQMEDEDDDEQDEKDDHLPITVVASSSSSSASTTAKRSKKRRKGKGLSLASKAAKKQVRRALDLDGESDSQSSGEDFDHLFDLDTVDAPRMKHPAEWFATMYELSGASKKQAQFGKGSALEACFAVLFTNYVLSNDSVFYIADAAQHWAKSIEWKLKELGVHKDRALQSKLRLLPLGMENLRDLRDHLMGVLLHCDLVSHFFAVGSDMDSILVDDFENVWIATKKEHSEMFDEPTTQSVWQIPLAPTVGVISIRDKHNSCLIFDQNRKDLRHFSIGTGGQKTMIKLRHDAILLHCCHLIMSIGHQIALRIRQFEKPEREVSSRAMCEILPGNLQNEEAIESRWKAMLESFKKWEKRFDTYNVLRWMDFLYAALYEARQMTVTEALKGMKVRLAALPYWKEACESKQWTTVIQAALGSLPGMWAMLDVPMKTGTETPPRPRSYTQAMWFAVGLTLGNVNKWRTAFTRSSLNPCVGIPKGLVHSTRIPFDCAIRNSLLVNPQFVRAMTLIILESPELESNVTAVSRWDTRITQAARISHDSPTKLPGKPSPQDRGSKPDNSLCSAINLSTANAETVESRFSKKSFRKGEQKAVQMIQAFRLVAKKRSNKLHTMLRACKTWNEHPAEDETVPEHSVSTPIRNRKKTRKRKRSVSPVSSRSIGRSASFGSASSSDDDRSDDSDYRPTSATDQPADGESTIAGRLVSRRVSTKRRKLRSEFMETPKQADIIEWDRTEDVSLEDGCRRRSVKGYLTEDEMDEWGMFDFEPSKEGERLAYKAIRDWAQYESDTDNTAANTVRAVCSSIDPDMVVDTTTRLAGVVSQFTSSRCKRSRFWDAAEEAILVALTNRPLRRTGLASKPVLKAVKPLRIDNFDEWYYWKPEEWQGDYDDMRGFMNRLVFSIARDYEFEHLNPTRWLAQEVWPKLFSVQHSVRDCGIISAKLMQALWAGSRCAVGTTLLSILGWAVDLAGLAFIKSLNYLVKGDFRYRTPASLDVSDDDAASGYESIEAAYTDYFKKIIGREKEFQDYETDDSIRQLRRKQFQRRIKDMVEEPSTLVQMAAMLVNESVVSLDALLSFFVLGSTVVSLAEETVKCSLSTRMPQINGYNDILRAMRDECGAHETWKLSHEQRLTLWRMAETLFSIGGTQFRVLMNMGVQKHRWSKLNGEAAVDHANYFDTELSSQMFLPQTKAREGMRQDLEHILDRGSAVFWSLPVIGHVYLLEPQAARWRNTVVMCTLVDEGPYTEEKTDVGEYEYLTSQEMDDLRAKVATVVAHPSFTAHPPQVLTKEQCDEMMEVVENGTRYGFWWGLSEELSYDCLYYDPRHTFKVDDHQYIAFYRNEPGDFNSEYGDMISGAAQLIVTHAESVEVLISSVRDRGLLRWKIPNHPYALLSFSLPGYQNHIPRLIRALHLAASAVTCPFAEWCIQCTGLLAVYHFLAEESPKELEDGVFFDVSDVLDNFLTLNFHPMLQRGVLTRFVHQQGRIPIPEWKGIGHPVVRHITRAHVSGKLTVKQWMTVHQTIHSFLSGPNRVSSQSDFPSRQRFGALRNLGFDLVKPAARRPAVSKLVCDADNAVELARKVHGVPQSKGEFRARSVEKYSPEAGGGNAPFTFYSLCNQTNLFFAGLGFRPLKALRAPGVGWLDYRDSWMRINTKPVYTLKEWSKIVDIKIRWQITGLAHKQLALMSKPKADELSAKERGCLGLPSRLFIGPLVCDHSLSHASINCNWRLDGFNEEWWLAQYSAMAPFVHPVHRIRVGELCVNPARGVLDQMEADHEYWTEQRNKDSPTATDVEMDQNEPRNEDADTTSANEDPTRASQEDPYQPDTYGQLNVDEESITQRGASTSESPSKLGDRLEL